MKKEIINHKITELDIQNITTIKETLFNAVSAYLIKNDVKPGDTVHLKIGEELVTIQIDNYIFEKMQDATLAF